MVAAPDRSLEQRMDALQIANGVRFKRATLKRELKAGRASVHLLLVDPPEFTETMKVFDLLLAVPRLGRVKVNRALMKARVSPSKTVGGLSDRQRAELVSLIGPQARGVTTTAGFPLSRGQEDVLGVICDRRDVPWAGPLAVALAKQLGTTSLYARQTIAALQRRGLLDLDAEPTPDGRDAYQQILTR